MTNQVSKCCNAEVKAVCGCDSDAGHKGKCDCAKSGGATWHNQCQACKQPCAVEYEDQPPKCSCICHDPASPNVFFNCMLGTCWECNKEGMQKPNQPPQSWEEWEDKFIERFAVGFCISCEQFYRVEKIPPPKSGSCVHVEAGKLIDFITQEKARSFEQGKQEGIKQCRTELKVLRVPPAMPDKYIIGYSNGLQYARETLELFANETKE